MFGIVVIVFMWTFGLLLHHIHRLQNDHKIKCKNKNCASGVIRYHLVVCWVHVLGFVCSFGTGVSLGRMERPMASPESLQGPGISHF